MPPKRGGHIARGVSDLSRFEEGGLRAEVERTQLFPVPGNVILRRVERARQLLHAGTDLSLAEVAVHAGFSDQSQFSRHFKRLVGVTPGQFRTPARIA